MKYKESGIEGKKRALLEAKEEFLRANGWLHTSSNPAFIWLWVKEGFSLSTELAIEMEIGIQNARK